MKHIKPELAWVTDPAYDSSPSPHGAQWEDQIIRDYLPGWGREISDEMKLAFFPHCTLQRLAVGEDGRKRVETYSSLGREGNSRGRGISWLDAGKAVEGRSCGGSVLSLKGKTGRIPKGGHTPTYASDVDLCRGSLARPTLGGGIESLRKMARDGKALPLVVIHHNREQDGGQPTAYAIVDLPTLIACAPASTTERGWSGESMYGLPLKNEGAEHPRKRGHPVPVWIDRDEHDGREYFTVKCSSRTFPFLEWDPTRFRYDVERAATWPKR